MTAADGVMPAPPPPPEPDWHRLDARMMAVKPVTEAAGLLLPVILVMFVGGLSPWKLWGAAAVAAALVLSGLFRWLTTSYRISETHVQLHSGLLVRKERSVPRDRLRTVDVTSDLIHRVFGLSIVKVGTGRNDGAGSEDELTLDAVSAAEAERLRQVLLRRAPARETAPDEERPAGGNPPLAALDHRWLRYAPLTLSGLVAVGAMTGGAFQLLQQLDIDPRHFGPLEEAVRWAAETALPVVVGAVVLVLLALVIGGAFVIYVVQYWHFRLTREDDGTLRVRRGLLTTRSVSIEEQRLRGVSLSEPLLLRAGGGARCGAVGTGLGTGEGSELLLPPAPLSEAHRVAGEVLRCDPPPTTTSLRRHPAAARQRRLIRALVPSLVVAVVLAAGAWIGWLPHWPWLVAVVAVPFFAWLGLDRYRNLGHALTSRYVVSRGGSLLRTTVALQRTGVIGWRIRQSFFQRLAGLATIGAVTAAGEGVYEVLDVDLGDGLALADAAVPDLLAPFLETPEPG
ncbi:hypothetical protein GCM10012275_49200 [Longimycelium tulufanense]|uniref:YdbS-like PH domain-containing protein n=1 Tax=Longimycelium tulufanense TaxID=907463 RepID=A0A8J3CFU3_9PSEU|nr:PH domain-containing protein [Longimycelium tulufanense]GGM72705.1 hypothetical protein GCM10012275_49200 [Longimycelium tulufanense]